MERAKGVTKNYNTKTNEKLHGPIKDSYHLRTNFKNVASQILKADHICFASLLIRRYIDDQDEYTKSLKEDRDEMQVPSPLPSNKESFPPSHHHSLGSVQQAVAISDIDKRYAGDMAFKNFRKKLSAFLSNFLPVHGINLPENFSYPVKLNAEEKVCFQVVVLCKF